MDVFTYILSSYRIMYNTNPISGLRGGKFRLDTARIKLCCVSLQINGITCKKVTNKSLEMEKMCGVLLIMLV